MNVPAVRGIESSETPGAERPGRAEDLARKWIITRRSAHTRFAYGRDIGVPFPRPGVQSPGPLRPAKAPSWLEFCVGARLDPLAGIAVEHVAVWVRLMESAGLAPATVARKLAAVSSWYAWLVLRQEVAANPAAGLPRPYVDPDTSKTPGLTREQALALVHAADADTGRQAARNSALIAMLLFTGARVSEACGARTSDLGIDRGHRVVWVTRKGGALAPLALPAPAAGRLDTYLATRPDVTRLPARQGETGSPAPLFATSTGKPMRPAEVWKLVRRLGKAAGLPPELLARICTHGMRHTFATLALDAGVSLRDLQDAMDHKDPRTTRRYDRARGRLDRSPGYTLAAYLADAAHGE